MPELRISTDKVCAFIEAARELAGKVPSTAGDRTTTGDNSKLVTIEDYPGDGERRRAAAISRRRARSLRPGLRLGRGETGNTTIYR